MNCSYEVFYCLREEESMIDNASGAPEDEIIGVFCVLQKKADPDIVPHKTVRKMADIEEYIRKIDFYLPEMKRLLYDGVEIDYYPRRSLYAFNTPCGLCDYAGLCVYGSLEGYAIGYDATERRYAKPFVSPTETIRYETCPRQWAYYKTGIKSVYRAATAECGTCLHRGIFAYIMEGEDPVEVFREEWYRLENEKYLKYGQKERFKSLLDIGEKLMKKFPEKWESWGVEVISAEQKTSVEFDSFILKGKPDLKGRKDGRIIIWDWKFTAVNYNDIWTLICDQMTGYAALHLLQPAEVA